MQHVQRMTLLISHKMFEYKIWHHVSLRECNFNEIQEFTLINLLLKLKSPASIFFNIEIEKLFKIIFSMVINLNRQNFVYGLS